MIELLTAGAILVIGLTGIVALLMRSTAVARSGVSAANSVTLGNSTLQEITAVGYDYLTPVTGADAGRIKDEAGRTFDRLVTIEVADGGGTTPAYLVTVQVLWKSTGTQTVPDVTTVSTIISRKPDGG